MRDSQIIPNIDEGGEAVLERPVEKGQVEKGQVEKGRVEKGQVRRVR